MDDNETPAVLPGDLSALEIEDPGFKTEPDETRAALARGEHPAADAEVPAEALAASEVYDNNNGVGQFGLGDQIYGLIGSVYHVVADGYTTVCSKQVDPQGSPTVRLSKPPAGMLCGTCLGRLIGA